MVTGQAELKARRNRRITLANRVSQAASSIQDVCCTADDGNPSEQVLRRKLATLTKAVKDFDEAHSMVLESIRLEGHDVDLEANVDAEIYS